jgi:formate hydrogenlyase subunit 3/multisubunit Na+/H+ antiporter MnhD subunit
MLIVLAILSLLVFVVPTRLKYGLALLLAGGGVAFGMTAAVVSFSGAIGPEPGGWLVPIPRVDRLSALFLAILSVAAASVFIYARDYVKAYAAKKSAVHLSVHYLSLLWMFLAMLGVVIFRQGFEFLLCWEFMTLASFLLILFEGEKRETRRAAINYLILMHIGFVFLVAGFVTASGDGTLGGFDRWGTCFATRDPLPLFILLLIGFGMKAGIFPLHVWLPEAHPAAPSHVSALMSGVMIKMGVYGVLRLLAAIGTGGYSIGLIVLLIGIATALWGIVQAALQNDLKKLLAYSSIENIGILFVGLGAGMLGLSTANGALALFGFTGALLHAVNHSLFKPLLFMGAGSVGLAARTRNLEELGGLSKRMPVTTVFFLIGAVAICALPPFNGFVSEFLIYFGWLRSTAAGSTVIWSMAAMAALALVGGVAALVFAKAFGIGFLGEPRSAKATQVREVSRWMLAAQAIPLAGILLIGLAPGAVVTAVRDVVCDVFPAAGFGSIGAEAAAEESLRGISVISGVLIAIVLGLGFWRRQVQRNRTISESPTWGCGFTAPNSRMEYTGESFSEGLEHLSNSPTNIASYKNRRGEAVPHEEIFARPRGFGIRHKDSVDNLVSQRWAYFVRKVNGRLALFQTGKINHYILHALLFLVLIFLISWIGLI